MPFWKNSTSKNKVSTGRRRVIAKKDRQKTKQNGPFKSSFSKRTFRSRVLSSNTIRPRRSRSGHATKSISQRYTCTGPSTHTSNGESNRRGRIKPVLCADKKGRLQINENKKKERPKIGALRRVSNFVHGRACFAGIRGIKEKYDDTGRARAVIR